MQFVIFSNIDYALKRKVISLTIFRMSCVFSRVMANDTTHATLWNTLICSEIMVFLINCCSSATGGLTVSLALTAFADD